MQVRNALLCAFYGRISVCSFVISVMIPLKQKITVSHFILEFKVNPICRFKMGHCMNVMVLKR